MLALASCGVTANSSSDEASDSSPDVSSDTSNTDVSSNTNSDTVNVNSGSEDEYGFYYSASWPSQVIATFLDGSGVTAVIPSFSSPAPFYFLANYAEPGAEYLEIATEIEASAQGDYYDQEVTYNAALTEAGYTIEATDYDEYGFFAVNAEETVVIQYFWWEGFFAWYIAAL
jgi:hypothetical protein